MSADRTISPARYMRERLERCEDRVKELEAEKAALEAELDEQSSAYEDLADEDNRLRAERDHLQTELAKSERYARLGRQTVETTRRLARERGLLP